MSVDLAAAIQTIVPVLGALGVAGLVTAWYSSAKDRRAARAGVLTALAAVEAVRWTPSGDENVDLQRLRDEMQKLETAILISRLPRSVLYRYAPLCLASISHAAIEMERHNSRPEETAVDPDLDTAVRYAAETVSAIAWSGGLGRRTRLVWRHRQLDRKLRTLRDTANMLLLRAQGVFR